MMLHTIYTMSIRRYAEMKETENAKLLRRSWNPFPVNWFDTGKFFDEFNNVFGSNQNLNADIYRSKTWNLIVMLETMYKTSVILMQAQNNNTLFSILLRRKHKDIKSNLELYREKIKKITRIDIFDKDGLKKLAKEIQRRVDKYNERNQKQEEPTEIDFMELAYGVFNVCEIPFNERMTLFEFAKLKHRADKILKQRKAKTDGRH